MQQMAEIQEDVDQQDLQYLVSDAVWDHAEVQDQLVRDADRLLGGHEDSMLLLDETAFGKKGKKSAGVSRQWNGRLGKVDNCQVGVFGALCRGTAAVLVLARLYLPKCWTEDPKRCKDAHIPENQRTFQSKSQIALGIVKRARASGARFVWVGADAGYGKEPQYLRELGDSDERFMVNVHKTQRFFEEDPKPFLPTIFTGKGRPPKRLTTKATSVSVEMWAKSQPETAWSTVDVRHSTMGLIRVQAMRRTAWIWDHEEPTARRWTVLVVRELGHNGKTSYALSNAADDLPLQQLVQAERQRFWIEQAFRDAKTELGLADYQARNWNCWHRHMTLCMMAHLFTVETRLHEVETIPMLSVRDIRTALAHLLANPGSTDLKIFENIANRQRQRWESTRKRYEKQGVPPTWTGFGNPIM